MNSSLYAPSKERTVMTTDEALELASSTYAYTTKSISIKDLNLNGEGLVYLRGTEYPITVDGMRGLCARLRIPNPFAERIPYDLLKTNVLRLARDKADEELTAHIRNDNAVVNISKGLTVPPNNAEIISRTRELFRNTPASYRINLSDRGLDIDLVRENLKNIEARVGDPITVGLRISTSESSFWTGYAKTLLYILRCTNGAVMSKTFGQVKLRIKHEHNPQTVYNAFFRKVSELTPNFDWLSQLLTRSNEEFFSDEALVAVWKSLTRMGIDNDQADELTLLTEDVRDVIISRVKARKKVNDLRPITNRELPSKTGIRVYDVFDKTTSFALICNQELRQGVQELAGRLIADLDKPSNTN